MFEINQAISYFSLIFNILPSHRWRSALW